MREQGAQEENRRFLAQETEEAKVPEEYGQVFDRAAEQQEHERNLPLKFLNPKGNDFAAPILPHQGALPKGRQIDGQEVVAERALVVAQEQDPREAEDREQQRDRQRRS